MKIREGKGLLIKFMSESEEGRGAIKEEVRKVCWFKCMRDCVVKMRR